MCVNLGSDQHLWMLEKVSEEVRLRLGQPSLSFYYPEGSDPPGLKAGRSPAVELLREASVLCVGVCVCDRETRRVGVAGPQAVPACKYVWQDMLCI